MSFVVLRSTLKKKLKDGEEKKVWLQELDKVKVCNALARVQRKSRNAKKWACNAFDQWRLSSGLSTEKFIADLSKEMDLHLFVDLSFQVYSSSKKSGWKLVPFYLVSFLVYNYCFTLLLWYLRSYFDLCLLVRGLSFWLISILYSL
jgi:hypothetical protein